MEHGKWIPEEQGWQKQSDGLCKDFTFKDFNEAFAFMTRVAMLAEEQDHHPNWSNTYNRVHICLCTHSAGNSISQKDYTLAAAIDTLFL